MRGLAASLLAAGAFGLAPPGSPDMVPLALPSGKVLTVEVMVRTRTGRWA